MPVALSGSGSKLLVTGLITLANVLLPIGLVIFALGFFPYKPVLPGLARADDYRTGENAQVPGIFDKVVFMVVDALRSDFVFAEGSGFQRTQQLIREGFAVPFTAHATSPTITMPRIKALTTGGIPSFLDVILNFDEADTSSSLAHQDTWLAQMKQRQNGKLLFYGDDTWLKLFPGAFDRMDGTSSFFVSDFTEVDTNVTRHVADELAQSDWNTMILHYLGLDHIGHKTGPRGPSMLPKQREMDDIVQTLFAGIESQPHLASTLLVLCGDHGMNDAGNHGASSAGETSPALVFLSPKFRKLGYSYDEPTGKTKRCDSPLSPVDDFVFYSVVEQSDVVPTLAALLGIPISKNNLGILIPEFLPLWSPDQQKMLLRQSAWQLRRIVEAAFPASTGYFDSYPSCKESSEKAAVESLACSWHSVFENSNSMLHENSKQHVYTWLRSAQALMTSMASNYDMPRLYQGIGLTVTALVISSAALLVSRTSVIPRGTSATHNSAILPFVGTAAAYGMMMFASSYVEEEHHFWYWITTLYLVYLGLRRFGATTQPSPSGLVENAVVNFVGYPCTDILKSLITLTFMRLLRGWNQTGQKWAGQPDIFKLYVLPFPNLLWLLVFTQYAVVSVDLARKLAPLLGSLFLASMWALSLFSIAFSFKIAFVAEDAPELLQLAPTVNFLWKLGGGLGNGGFDLAARARILFLALGLLATFAIHSVLTEPRAWRRRDAIGLILSCLEHFCMTQSRLSNVPLFLILRVLRNILVSLEDLQDSQWTLVTLMLEFASFFAFGGTNAISSVDLSNAYNGVTSFNVVVVGILTFVGNWAPSLLWTLWRLQQLMDKNVWRPSEQRDWAVHMQWKKNTTAQITDTCSESLYQVATHQVETSQVQEQIQHQAAQNEFCEWKKLGTGVWTAHITLLTAFVSCNLAAVMIACTVLRNHLFIWTVFSPKYLYSMAWCLGQHLGVRVLLSGLMWWIGTT